jgi:hypothetical protein
MVGGAIDIAAAVGLHVVRQDSCVMETLPCGRAGHRGGCFARAAKTRDVEAVSCANSPGPALALCVAKR